MPGQKQVKVHRQNAHRAADANNNVHVIHENNNNGPRPAGQQNQRMVRCCRPSGCEFRDELIDNENPEDAVRVMCNNETCVKGTWMHKNCFGDWEQSVLAYLKSCGRARSWSEKQRLQNLWTKKGYDLAYKACDCSCSRGHLRKDLDYVPAVRLDNAASKKKHKKKTVSKPELNNGNPTGRERRYSGNGNSTLNNNQLTVTNANTQMDNAKDVDNNHIRKSTPSIAIKTSKLKDQQRIRTDSISSTGSSPANSVSSCNSGSGSPDPINQQTTQNGAITRVTARPKFEVWDNNTVSMASTSIFRRRADLSAFSVLPKHKQNPYHIKMEDDNVTGNDDVRNFVLNHLSTSKITALNCVLCKSDLCIFDRYPLVDGTLFLSPQAYDNQALRVISEGRLQYINAVCVSCLEGKNDINCAACKRKWDGSALLLGSMYSYDIFAAMPCCQKRLTCKHCRRAVIDVKSGLAYFSEYSHMIPCPYCKAYDYHFIRPLNETFHLKMLVWH